MGKIADLAYQTIRDRIISGEYQSGAHLKEEQVAQDIGASRTPVRKALRRLNAEQLVEFAPNRGAMETHLSAAQRLFAFKRKE